MTATFLITGGAGFIGSHLARNILAKDDAVKVLDNFSTGRREDLAEILDKIDLAEGERIEPVFEPDRAGDVKHSLADITKAKEIMGYDPQVYFAEGLRRTVDWYRIQG